MYETFLVIVLPESENVSKKCFFLCFNLLSTVIEWGGGWGFISHFPINWMLRSFKCIEISLSDQTPRCGDPL